jgi:hypothetical protein
MFYAYALLDDKGAEQYDLHSAAQLAEDMYGDDWREVANGEDGISREEWLAEQEVTA